MNKLVLMEKKLKPLLLVEMIVLLKKMDGGKYYKNGPHVHLNVVVELKLNTEDVILQLQIKDYLVLENLLLLNHVTLNLVHQK
jgi:hypothetical protein